MAMKGIEPGAEVDAMLIGLRDLREWESRTLADLEPCNVNDTEWERRVLVRSRSALVFLVLVSE